MRANLALTLTFGLATTGSCDHEPNATRDSFAWEAAITEQSSALLAICSHQEKAVLVGGDSQSGLVLQQSRSLWLDRSSFSLPRMWWCWGDNNDLVVVGEGATAVHFRGKNARQETLPGANDETLYGVWGTGTGEFFAVGGQVKRPDLPPVAYRYRGASWESMDVGPLRGSLFKIWGTRTLSTGELELWAVGSRGTIARSKGERWSPVQSPTTESLIAVHGTDSNSVFAVGGDGRGVVLHYDGALWRELTTTPEPLAAVWASTNGDVVIGGNRGTIARLYGPSFQNIERKTIDPTLCIHSVFEPSPGAFLAAGGDLFAGRSNSWRGVLYSHALPFPSQVQQTSDAGILDAGRSTPDANSTLDGGSPGGQPCGQPPRCSSDNACWFLQESRTAICTAECESSSECTTRLGSGACCTRPGAQTFTRVCIPNNYAECQ